MTLITDLLDRAARQCSAKPPSSWITASGDTHVEIRDDFLLETVDDILDRVDLPSPIGKQTTLTAGGGSDNSDGSENFTLPDDFKRLMRDEYALYDVLQDRPVVPITTDGAWSNLTDIGASGSIKSYRLKGYEGNWTVDIYRSIGTVDVHYVSTLWMADSSGTAGSAFTEMDDVILLPRRLVEAGIVWRYRDRRGLPTINKMNEYEALLARLSNDVRARRSINFGGRESVRWQDLVPATIPSS